MDDVSAMLRVRGHVLTPADLVLSLDLDGTVWFGEPPGPIVADVVTGLQQASAVVGSASDRTVLDQSRLWQRAGIQPAFVVVKNRLEAIAPQFAERVLVHVGDRFADELEAANAGAIFLHVGSLSREEWHDTPRLMAAIASAWHARETRSVRDE